VMNTIEQESLDKTGLRSDVVTLYTAACTIFTATKNTPTCDWSRAGKAIAFFRWRP